MLDLDIFIPTKKESTVDFVMNTIKRLLISKKLNPGDILPSEALLAQSLQVSRGSIREAMKILSALGIVEIRRGDGTYIASTMKKALIDPLLFNLLLSRPNTREMVELRELIEFQVVQLVIKHADETDLEEIEKVHLDMKMLFIEKGGAEASILKNYDLQFHAALGHASKNILVEKIYAFVMELFDPFIEKTYDNEKNGANALVLHESIIRSLKDRDVVGVVEATQKSIEEWRQLLDEND